MADQRLEEYGERLAAVETGQKALFDGQRRIERSMEDLAHTVKSLTEAVQTSGKPNWQLLALITMLVGGGITWVLMEMHHESQERNIQWAVQNRMNQVLWNSGPLGTITKYPESPYYLP